MAKAKDSPCQKEACSIQSCLQKNGYQESKCFRELQRLKECCIKVHDLGLTSLCCPLGQNHGSKKPSSM
ncbi:Cx9C motif-containing protein 4, mitochondrial [Entomophthora muscae]|uniref:Cx9C motif-containing protein 4, mitochondrial n=1 Tax=Entomophthora muscae TaxID=34485 RepID=A0ACC2SNS8_9FUNG|nr:Cx9C motif-containing protein 4, mitochondrial [Entomophthora muscae]